MDTEKRTTPVQIKTQEKVARDGEDLEGLKGSTDAAEAAYQKALTPKFISNLCLGGFYSAALSDQGDVYTWGDGRCAPREPHPRHRHRVVLPPGGFGVLASRPLALTRTRRGGLAPCWQVRRHRPRPLTQ